MSYPDPNGGGYPPPREPESQYPPPPEDDERSRSAYHQRAPSSTSSVTLPSISPYETSQYGQRPNGESSPYGQQSNGYAQDPRGYAPQDSYRQSAPSGPYRDDRPYQPDYGRGGPQQMNFSQSAPRQRTAIACRYCRRRKIRCSGFDQNPEGRCGNCQRFQQDCIFTPVSSQAQAFVPAHTVYPHMRNMGPGHDGRGGPMYAPQGTPLFGAHGQPLGSVGHQPPGRGSPYEYPAPSPTSSYGSVEVAQRGQQPPYPQESSRKRPQQDSHPSILPPPMPNQPPYSRSDSANRRSAVEDDLRLPPVTPTGAQPASNYSPGSSTSSQSNLQPPQQQQGLPSMSRTPPPRTSPGESSTGRTDPMALGSIMEQRRDNNQIDRNMLGRLDRKGQ